MVAKRFVAITSFVFAHDGETIVVHAGDVLASAHPAVKNHRELFEVPVTTSDEGQR